MKNPFENMELIQERMRRYKPREFANENQAAIENNIVMGLISWGEKDIGEYYKLILDKGVWFIGRSLSKEYAVCKNFKKTMRPRMKQCFTNAQMFAVAHSEWGRYFEGYMCDCFVAVHHAWVVMPDDQVVDFTLEARDVHEKKLQMPPRSGDPIAYLGVEVPADFIIKKIQELKIHTPIAHMHYLGSTKLFVD